MFFPIFRSHSLEKKYECTYCKKRFSFQQTLRNHVFLHTGEKRFKCEICQISFRQIGHLQGRLSEYFRFRFNQHSLQWPWSLVLFVAGHQLIHTGQKPHVCSICKKAFALRGNLTVHMRTHAGATPHECNTCPKKFSDANGLKRHQMVHDRKNETMQSIEQILISPIIEAPEQATITQQPVFETAILQQPLFATAAPFNTINAETIQFVTQPDIAGDNSQIIFKTQ